MSASARRCSARVEVGAIRPEPGISFIVVPDSIRDPFLQRCVNGPRVKPGVTNEENDGFPPQNRHARGAAGVALGAAIATNQVIVAMVLGMLAYAGLGWLGS